MLGFVWEVLAAGWATQSAEALSLVYLAWLYLTCDPEIWVRWKLLTAARGELS